MARGNLHCHQLSRLEAELRAQKSVECRRISASLQIAREATPAFLAGLPGRLRCYDLSDAAEPMLAIGVMMVDFGSRGSVLDGEVRAFFIESL